ncbi:cysteine desulfurase [Bartonella krasnovii]|uniref:Cysteine desulfurase n=1 Tax=Bartonella krasnovii TaxID=2267275 RepID=A0ABY3VY37_9HYPH|nr:cysteine desulfurase [Bartonella krasnovii]UNF29995.1 cysteine desulfurase [Bartonella krasnovii]UNF36228.1 cysteine desulfurase [Bartonella krasnovii]UNF37931.1 cysteine desulfurase [Bartonella krasnovii]UNF41340.1 cysteine desulfurase [Bartonella krasnovii]UNF49469.1 cysteine desulfurase [Bartonella krasnovii]
MENDVQTLNYNVDKIRRDFPLLHHQVYGKRLAYLDSGASAQKPQSVLNAMNNYYHHHYANVHRGMYFLANTATQFYENSRETVRLFLNAQKAEEIIFTKNATEAINTVAYGWAMPKLKEGDEIVLTIMEHHANIIPWHFLREQKGVKLIFVPVDENGVLHIEDFQKALSEKTRLVAITHMSNILGTVPPVKEMIKQAHQNSIPVLVDGSQGAIHLTVDVQDLDCDWYVFTGHKLYGPTGVGVLYGKEYRLEEMHPFQGGGEMIEEVTTDKVLYNAPPYRFEAGTPPIVEAVGLAAAIDYIQERGLSTIHAHEMSLSAYAHEKLKTVESLRIYGHSPNKGAIISFTIEGIHAHDIAMFIDRKGVAIRAGTHCAQPLLQRFGLTSICRASLAMYNTQEDIDQLVKALKETRTFFNG